VKESNLHRLIIIAASQAGHRLWRNNVGMLTDKRGIPVRYGLCVGSSDLIGLTRTGRFAAIEVKLPGKRATPEQLAFIGAVQRLGGIAGVACSEAEALALLDAG
jgi:hypothetical protein